MSGKNGYPCPSLKAMIEDGLFPISKRSVRKPEKVITHSPKQSVERNKPSEKR